jgi:hypothetical protein
MNDDRMDELLAEAAREYNAPTSVPREEIWSRIQAERGARRRERRTSRVWVWPSVGIAAAALLAIGVTLGRRMERSSVPPATTTTASIPQQPARDSSAQLLAQLRQETTATDRRVRDLAAANSSRGNDRGAAPTRPDNATSLSYHLVVLKHLAGSEAMITAFRSAARTGEIDAQIAAWSKELLSTTRMLEASVATDDPTMKRLLEDLDLVLAQIKQYVTRGTNSPEDLDLIEQSIIKRGVMTKLRSTAPARNVPAGI